MKHLKYFNQLNEKLDNKIEINSIIDNIFEYIKSKDEFKNVLKGADLEIAENIYDSFVDASEILELSQEDLQEFAYNLGIISNDNLVFSIMENIYNEKTKRNYKEDIQLTINNLIKNVNSVNDENLRKSLFSYTNELKKI